MVIDKSYAQVSRLFNKQWLSRHPRANKTFYGNESELKLQYEKLCDDARLTQKPTSVKNPQENAILKCLHAVINDMLHTSELAWLRR